MHFFFPLSYSTCITFANIILPPYFSFLKIRCGSNEHAVTTILSFLILLPFVYYIEVSHSMLKQLKNLRARSVNSECFIFGSESNFSFLKKTKSDQNMKLLLFTERTIYVILSGLG